MLSEADITEGRAAIQRQACKVDPQEPNEVHQRPAQGLCRAGEEQIETSTAKDFGVLMNR